MEVTMSVRNIASSEIPTDRSAIEGEGFTATVATFEAPPGGPGGWHHHGENHVIGYLISGTARIEWGHDGTLVTDPAPGDLIHIEPGTIHRETYEGHVALAGFTVGTGPGRVDVEGPG
jgi:quercetin dioxygenase-like cupin family protein